MSSQPIILDFPHLVRDVTLVLSLSVGRSSPPDEQIRWRAFGLNGELIDMGHFTTRNGTQLLAVDAQLNASNQSQAYEFTLSIAGIARLELRADPHITYALTGISYTPSPVAVAPPADMLLELLPPTELYPTPLPAPLLDPRVGAVVSPEIDLDQTQLIHRFEIVDGTITLGDLVDREEWLIQPVGVVNPIRSQDDLDIGFDAEIGLQDDAGRTQMSTFFRPLGDLNADLITQESVVNYLSIDPQATQSLERISSSSAIALADLNRTVRGVADLGQSAAINPTSSQAGQPNPGIEIRIDIPSPSTVRNPPAASNPIPVPLPGTNLARQARTKDLGALQEIYNISFDQRDRPDIHLGLASSNTVLLKVQQNELVNQARDPRDFVEEPFNRILTADDVEIVLPDGTALRPLAVHRKSKVANAIKRGGRFILDHYYHIELPQSLDSGSTYTLRFTDDTLGEMQLQPRDTISLAIHHARAYDLSSPAKVAKLSSWMGNSGGGVTYEPGTAFRVRNEATGQVVHRGQITLDASDDAFAGTDVFTLDFSAITQAGTYRIDVDGVGQSLAFDIRNNVWEDMLDLSLEGLYAHRAFIELDGTYVDFERPGNSDIVFYQSSVSEADFTFFDGGDEFEVLPRTADRTTPLRLTGGWFDAGDYDTKVEHISIITSLVDLYNSNPAFYRTFNPNLPESGDQIPDVLNEALWGMQLYKQLQRSDGSVSGGFEFDSHPDGTASWEETEAFIYAPDFFASYHFAIAAARLSTALDPFDPVEAADLRTRAMRAMTWAETEYGQLPASFDRQFIAEEARQLAALEIYRLTNDPHYHDIFRSINRRRNYDASFIYAQLDPAVYTAVDTDWQSVLTAQLIDYGDRLVDFSERNGFDTINDPGFGQTWGSNTVVTTQHAHYIAMAHQLTGDRKYLDALSASLQFGLGMNPDNMSFTTGTVERGLAYDEPDDVLHADGFRLDHIPDGITIYGFYDNPWPVWNRINQVTENTVFDNSTNTMTVPLLESFNDFHNFVPMLEYTVHQTIEDQIFAFGYVAGQL